MSSYTSTNSNNNSNNNNNNNNNANTSNTQNNSSNTSASRTTGETHSASRGPLLSMEQQDGRDGLAKNLANKDTRNLMITMGKSSKRNRGKSTGSEYLVGLAALKTAVQLSSGPALHMAAAVWHEDPSGAPPTQFLIAQPSFFIDAFALSGTLRKNNGGQQTNKQTELGWGAPNRLNSRH
ncbi:hypothetical protein IWX50DRAFT_712608 [Phyllosticta citricarpa]